MLGCCPLPAGAADDSYRLEIAPLVGYHFGGSFDIEGTDDAWDLDDSSSFGLLFDLENDANTQWELLYSRQQTRATLDSATLPASRIDVKVQALQLGGTYHGTGEKLRPYVAMTIGGTRIDADTASDTFFSGSIGAGLQVMPNARLGLRVEARAYATLTDSDSDLFCLVSPDQNVCAIRIEGEVLGQLQTFAGIVFRF